MKCARVGAAESPPVKTLHSSLNNKEEAVKPAKINVECVGVLDVSLCFCVGSVRICVMYRQSFISSVVFVYR